MNVSYLLLDAARLKIQIQKAIELNTVHASLYKGRNEENLANLGPYLFTIPEDENLFLDWYKTNGWGNAWGVLIESASAFEEVYTHFSNFLIVKTEEGKELYFRFYDPRVLRVFLPTCDADQLKEFFGPIGKFICEDEDAAFAIHFSFNGRQLVTEKIIADKVSREVNPVTEITPGASEMYVDTTKRSSKSNRKISFDND